MADYRNLPLKFLLGGINVAAPPENLEPGQVRIGLNVRPNTEGIIEGRSPTKNIFMTQPTIGGHTFVYPTNWSTGKLREIRFLGSVTVNAASTEGYLSIHSSTPIPSGFPDSGFRTFLNGAVVKKKTGFATYSALDPVGISIVRTNAANGVPVILIDGQWYLVLSELNLDSPHATDTINTGYLTLSGVPIFNAKRLGIPKPAAAPTVATNSTGLTGDYYYRISGYDSTTGFQGPPSAISTVITLTNQGARATFTDTNTYGNFSHFRLWRLGGTLPNTWRLVGNVASTNSGGSIFIDDATSDANAALNEALDTDTVEVFNTISSAGAVLTAQKFNYAFGPFVGKYVFWVGDPVRKNYIYWNKLTDLSRHNPSFDVNAVSDPGEVLLNGFIFGNHPYVFSDKRLYSLDFAGEDAQPAFVPREVPIGLGAVGRQAFAVAPNIVFLCSKDGIYATDCQSSTPTNIINDTLKPLFRGEDVAGLEAIDYTQPEEIRMNATNKELHFIYKGKTTNSTFHLVYDVQASRWFQWTTNGFGVVYANEGIVWNQLLLGDYDSQNVHTFDDVFFNEDESYTAQLRSGSLDAGAPLTFKEWGVLILDFEPNGADITITPFYNSETTSGAVLQTDTIGDSNPRRTKSFSLDDFYAKNISLQFSWVEEPTVHPKLFQALLLYREDEEEVVHWEHVPQSLGQGGLYHVKDSYWGVRSNAPITLTVSVDGVEDIYEDAIASTSGVRKKLYLDLLPRVGTVWGFKLESDQPFRIYGEDCALFAKPWQTENSYQALTPFSQAGYAAYLRKGGGT